MRAYYISNKYDGCYYVRCLLPLIHNGWNGAKTSLEGQKASSEKMFDDCMKSDIIVFQRPDTEDKTQAIELLKKAGKKIVFDNDDTYRPDSGFPKLNEAHNQREVKKINDELYKNIKQADLVTTTTEFLAEEYRPLNNNVVILPNCIDPFDWDKPLRNEGDKVRIGLVGSVAYGDYQIISNYLKELCKRDDVQVVMFSLSDVDKKLPKGNAFAETYKKLYKESLEFVNSNNIEWHPIVPMSKYPETLNNLKLDIMLIPRVENYFNKCKSNVKFLEASMCEIPVIASSFSDGNSPYDKDLDGENGLLAKTEADWIEMTERLIRNKDLRRSIGKRAKEYTLNNYNIEDKYHLWYDAYSKLCEK
jgi:glycosyltransferase involved in cell wall biosynthesis